MLSVLIVYYQSICFSKPWKNIDKKIQHLPNSPHLGTQAPVPQRPQHRARGRCSAPGRSARPSGRRPRRPRTAGPARTPPRMRTTPPPTALPRRSNHYHCWTKKGVDVSEQFRYKVPNYIGRSWDKRTSNVIGIVNLIQYVFNVYKT